jgi:hypothetical protein
MLKEMSALATYRLNSFPTEVRDSIRVARCRLARSKEFRGYCAAKRRYFYGVKMHVVTTAVIFGCTTLRACGGQYTGGATGCLRFCGDIALSCCITP